MAVLQQKNLRKRIGKYLRLAVAFALMGLAMPYLSAQTPYHYMNEWYRFNQNYIKLLVSEDGPYRVLKTDLVLAGVPNLATLDPDYLQVFYRGEEVPISVKRALDGGLEYFEFEGRKNDGLLDTAIYYSPHPPFVQDPSQQPNIHHSFFTDTSAYFVTWDSVGLRRRTDFQPTQFAGRTPAPYFRQRALTEFNQSYFEGGGGATDVSHVLNPDYITGEGFASTEFSTGSPVDVVLRYVQLPGYLNTPNKPFMQVRAFSSTTSEEHITSITVNSVEVHRDTTQGIQISTRAFDLNIPLATTVLVRLHAYGNGSRPDRQLVAWHSIDYDRSFNMGQSNRTVVHQWSAQDTTYLRFYNAVYDSAAFLYDPLHQLRINAQIAGDTLRFLVPGGAPRDLYFYTDLALKKPLIQPHTALANLSDPNGGAEFLIITHQRFANSAAHYAAYRDTNTVNNYSTKIVYVDQILDEFGYGSLTPLAIKNFLKYTLDHWNTKPQFVMLWGKGQHLPRIDNEINYVPAWGKPVSDYAYVSNFDPNDPNWEPQISIGRVNIYEDEAGMDYLEKVMEYEHTPYAPWMKKAVFLGGGTDSEQLSIRYALIDTAGSYKTQLEAPPVGGDVKYYQKSNGGVLTNSDEESHTHIDRGVGIIHFFGHSATNIFDVDILEANRYQNYHKYPFMVAFGCYGGDFLGRTTSFGERFVLEPGRGSIGYLANSTAGFLGPLSDYGRYFYDELTGAHFGRPVGEVIRHTIRRYADENNGYANILVANHCKQMNLQGDPSVILNLPQKPDIASTEPQVWFNSETISAQDEQFTMNIAIDNHGRSFQDSFWVRVTQRIASGQLIEHPPVLHPPILLEDTASLVLQNTVGRSMAGLNTFTIYLDDQDSLDEYYEDNNVITKVVVIQGSAPAILYPYEFAVVGESQPSLVASTYVVSRSGDVRYEFEIDTLHTFGSAFKQASGVVTGTASKAEWPLPFQLQAGKVYYWRVRLADMYPVQWSNASFKYVPDKYGWAQSRPAQFLGDPTAQILIDSVSLDWRFDLRTIQLHAFIHSFGLTGRPEFFFGSYTSAGSPPAGVMYTTIDHRTLATDVQNILWGDWHYLAAPTAGDPNTLAAMVQAIAAAETGDYLLMVTSLDPQFGDWPESVLRALEMVGVRYSDVAGLENGDQAILLGRKGGSPGSAILITEPNLPMGNQQAPRLDLIVDLSSQYDSAVIRSPLIGPAKAWADYRYDWHSSEIRSQDSVRSTVMGVRIAEQEVPALQGLESGLHSLASLDAAEYSRIALEAYPEDKYSYTAPQLDNWEVYYMPAPDLMADPNNYFSIPDTIEEGQIVNVQFGLQNPTAFNSDSVRVRFQFQRADRSLRYLGEQNYAPMTARTSVPIGFRFHSAGKGLQEGTSYLLIEVNPDEDQIEQHRFNNTFAYPIYVKTDKVGPLMDVTVDGKHLMDGDFVQPEPEILIQVNDENPYLPVTISDSTYFIWFGRERTYQFNEQIQIATDARVQATPGRVPENKAQLSFKPGRLEDGEYTLAVQSRDFKGNAAGDPHYIIRFNVESAKTMSEVLPYPNPFSTSTRFVYTLTGDEKPYVFELQIYTITGRLVKVIDLLEMGEVYVGYNITDYAWDGRDEFGDLLANGVYIYKTNVKFRDRYGVERRDEGVSEYFKNGYGKLYILR